MSGDAALPQDVFAHDPMRPFYNLDGFSAFAMTSDIDWAPDFAVAHVLQLFADAGLKLTIFATNETAPLLGAGANVEVGLHPDTTRPGPNNDFAGKVRALKEMYPDAVGVRAHRNFFGQNIAQASAALGLKYDASVFLWRRPYCQGLRDQYGLWRLTYCWEDGIHADMGLPWTLDEVPIAGPGLKLFNVHPIFIYLNCPNDDHRRAAVKPFPDLTRATEAELKPHVYDGYGARSFLIDLLAKLKGTGARDYLLREMVAEADRGYAGARNA